MPRRPKDPWPPLREAIRKAAAERRGKVYTPASGRPITTDRVQYAEASLHLAKLVAKHRDAGRPVNSELPARGKDRARDAIGAALLDAEAEGMHISRERVRRAPKAVLISLADNANDAGKCWPSLTKISERTCVCRRSVIDAIHWLEEAGHLTADRTNGRHTRYLVTAEPRSFEDVKAVRHAHQCAKRTSAAHAPTGASDAPDPCAKRTLTVNNQQEPYTHAARVASPGTSPPPGALAARAMIEAGMPARCMNPLHPELLAALAAGVTSEELGAAAREVISRGTGTPAMVYVIRTVMGRRRTAAAQQGLASTPAANHPRSRRDERPRSANGRMLAALKRCRARRAEAAAASFATTAESVIDVQ